MNNDELKLYLESCSKLLSAENVVSVSEAENRAGRFLEAQYHIAIAIHGLYAKQLKLTSLKDIQYAQLMSQDQAKNVTEKKSNTEAHPDYVSVREQYDAIENDITELKTLGKLFENAHIFFRNKAKGE